MSEQFPRFAAGQMAILRPAEEGTPLCLLQQFGNQPIRIDDVDDAPPGAGHPQLVRVNGRKISGAWLLPHTA